VKPADAKQRVVITDGTLEALKWLGLILMTLDHINKYIFACTLPGAYELGRMAMPLFGFVMAYNLARPGALAAGAHDRTMVRLALFGLIASPFFMGLGGPIAGGWWPLNIMFMLLLVAGIVHLVEQGGIAYRAGAVVLFILGGAMVEYWWFALVFILATWWYFKTSNRGAVLVSAMALTALFVINKNLWALAALPLMLVAPWVDLKIPRLRHVFYVFYPAHLAALLVLSTVMKTHGAA
jgi:hypothetical protein